MLNSSFAIRHSSFGFAKPGTFRFRDPLNPAFAKRLRVGRQERRFLPLRLDDAPIKGSLTQFLQLNSRLAALLMYCVSRQSSR